MSEGVSIEKARGLAQRVANDLGGAHIMALAYIGNRLGIFEGMASGEAMTSVELAQRTGLHERYIREWASAMTAAEYIEYDPEKRAFRMTPEQAMVLADERSPFYLAGGFLYAQACVRQVPRLMESFREGGGVSFVEFGPEIVEAIDKMFAAGYALSVASQWIPAIPDIHERLETGAVVGEVGCGAGQALVPVARAFPNSRFVGFDIDAISLERAREKTALSGLSGRLSFELVAAENLPPEPRFDLIMAFNCVHDMAHPRPALRGVRNALREHGALLWSEANVSDHLEENIGPMGRLLYAASTMHCMTVSLASDGEGIGTVLGPGLAAQMADEAGFSSFQRLNIEHPYHQLFLLRK